MNQEDKELLLKDLSARLPYKPKIKVSSLWNENKEVEEDIVDSVYCVMPDGYINTETIDSDISLDDIVLYLRPMSSMTEEEEKEYLSIDNRSYSCPIEYAHIPASDRIDWLNSHHFDYRGLIEKDLAIEVTKENNPYNKIISTI